jgi:hypothetical protein
MGGIIIRKVELSMNEQVKYETIKYLVDHPEASKVRASLRLHCTVRHVNRMIAGYRKEGKAFFIHGNRGRKPANTVDKAIRTDIVALYSNKYYDANFTHFTELLERLEGIKLSPSTVAGILEEAGIYSPRITKKKKRRIRKELEIRKLEATTKREADRIQANLVAIEDAHSRRPRCAYFGEMQQMDASPFEWVPGQIWHLHAAIDDASGCITGAWFDTQETLNAYYHVLHQILTDHGIPYKILTDNRSVFTYKKKESPSIDEDSHTQFAYACHQLGIELDTTSVPQAKGRIERLNQTLQSRLPVELRLAGITTIDAANEFLYSYIKEFNAKFSMPLNGIKSAFEEQPSDDRINLILAVLSERTVDSGHCIKYKNDYYKMLDSSGKQVHYQKGTKAMLIEAFDGNKYCCVNDTDVYALEMIPEHQETSKDLDLNLSKPRIKVKKRVIPPMNSPWRTREFKIFVKKQHYIYYEITHEDTWYTTENIYESRVWE